ncbi:hypothetical protein MKW98_017305 [Papaver atlanticum]|uniref:Neprosin PEP catalytic domain-containing protein n=1 Tax=Papaver atlanticum TaxID=357466 RepID=A0AAD4STC5_9MAGN|nr:hypothetical protein MKW98_017305 [Papaver atlanticum]
MSKFTDLKYWLLILTIFTDEGLVEGKTTIKARNKAIIKTIKVGNAEIIDCYVIYRQPSLNHPLLCNDTIQLTPSSYPKGTKLDNLGTLQLTQNWQKYGSCPEGTIPIRRQGKNYNPTLLRKHHYPGLSPYENLVTSQSNDTTENYRVHEHTIIGVHGNFRGAQAKINLWNPFTETREMSISQICIEASKYKDLNTIEVGWHVYQDIYGDHQTRFFIYWTTDGYLSTGCYNLLCNGFVHTSSNISLGCNFTEVSTFHGDQKDATFSIQKDRSSGHWWVHVQGTPIGYYPSSLFTELSKTATSAKWGRHTSTQMGSGHFPSEGGLKTSSYFNWVQVFDENNMIKDPKNVKKRVTKPNYYNLEIDSDHYRTNGYGFYYGGPGYNDKCQ